MTLYHIASVISAIALAAVLYSDYISRQRKETGSKSAPFKAFQKQYLVVYGLMVAADWVQGPYVFRLYQYYGFNVAENGLLFVAGFGSSMIFGTLAGSVADTYGRRMGAYLYVGAYVLSCLTKHINHFYVLILGRVLGGLATSLLFTVFEAWMVSEHAQQQHQQAWLQSTFSFMSIVNGLVAILSGWGAEFVAVTFDTPLAPFDLSIVLLLLGAGYVYATWSENYGDTSARVDSNLSDGVREVVSSPRVLVLGAIQSLFEASMYAFVFMWTPALQDDTAPELPFGTIFATFMVCCALGGSLFARLAQQMSVLRLMMLTFTVAGLSLAVPALSENRSARFLAFLAFEVCVGMYWPAIGTLRADVVQERVRTTVLNLFRVPLNLLVCLLLLNVGTLDVGTIFMLCALAQGLCTVLATQLAPRSTLVEAAPNTKPPLPESAVPS
eukprot:m.52941 g.52941  ORF g.52941 m.52941 type:complete len:441 (-) comp13533_c0_seq1:973-2295(-)